MKSIKLSMREFKGHAFSSDNHVICNKWGICFNMIFTSLEYAEEYYLLKGLKLPEYYIVRVDWYN